MSAKEIIINLIDRKVLSGKEAYAVIEAIVKAEIYKDNSYNPYKYPYVYWNTQPYTVTCSDTNNDSANSITSTSFSGKLKYAEPTISTLSIK